MKKFHKYIFLLFLGMSTAHQTNAQRLYVGAGATFAAGSQDDGIPSETALRYHFSYPNLIGKVGLYATIENFNKFPNWAQKVDNLGINYSISPSLQIYYGRGLLNMMTHNQEKFPLTGRQDLGLTYLLHDGAFKIDAGYSFWSGPHFQFSYGIPLVAADDDGDGIKNKKDKCPGTAAKYFSSLTETGCPKDSDNDGVPDIDDVCPNDAGKAFTQGCPDSDNDGIADKDDACPTEKGSNGEGCPDSDGDGITNDKDNCPNEAGTLDNAGCPVIEEPVEEHSDVEEFEVALDNLAELKTALKGTLPKFDLNSSVMNQGQQEALNTVAKLMKKYPNAKLMVEGYTDDQGSDSFNQWLSERRATTVQQYLIKQGIPQSRLEIKGYGATNFRVDGTTPEARAENRRVELKLIP